MSRAEKESSEQADHAKPRNTLIGTAPSDTIEACARVVDFLGDAAAHIDHGGGEVNGEAVGYIAMLVTDALRYEAERVQNARKAVRHG